MSDRNLTISTLTEHDRAVLANTSAADFDGHTGFDSLSPAARLEWLDAAVSFFSKHASTPTGRPQDLSDVDELQRLR